MFYILASLIAAMLYGFATIAIYGYDALTASGTVDYVFWWLIGTGIVLQLLDGHFNLSCLWRRLWHPRRDSPCAVMHH